MALVHGIPQACSRSATTWSNLAPFLKTVYYNTLFARLARYLIPTPPETSENRHEETVGRSLQHLSREKGWRLYW